MGGTESDQLSGGSGNDWLFGELAADALDGGEGDDSCNGGSNVPGRTSTKTKDTAKGCETTKEVP